MQSLQLSFTINAPAKMVWRALVDPLLIEQWGGGPAEMSHKVGTEFILWGGDIHGRNLEVEEEKKLVQEWYAGNWIQPSLVTFLLSEKNGITSVSLSHSNIPDKEFQEITDGWDKHYLGKIKHLLEKQTLS